MSAIRFEIVARAGRARAGVLTTPHGEIRTPAFVPVGTKANVKGIFPSALAQVGAEVVIANTYHLYLSPGAQLIKDGGGVAKFMNWVDGPHSAEASRGKPTMTDSGGFQVFSLGAAFGRNITKIAKGQEQVAHRTSNIPAVYDEDVATQHGQLAVIDEEGVTFTSHLDGTLHRFTPERSVEIQHALGADIFFAFDECTAPTEPYEYQKEAMERTHRWAERSLTSHRQNINATVRQALYGIVQGGRHQDLRRASAKEVASMEFDGFGIGGSFSKEDMQGALQAAVGELPPEKPRHFLGIGEPGDILEGIAEGMDTFDCVAPTRIGRHGSIYTKRGIVHLPNEADKANFGPLDPECIVPGTEGFTRAYVGHLIRSKEMLGSMLCSLHNEGFIVKLVHDAREALTAGKFEAFREEFVRNYYRGGTSGVL